MPGKGGDKVIPNIAKAYELSKDYKTLTVYLRRGMKWSDGVPFTADDFLFWYEDMFSNYWKIDIVGNQLPYIDRQERLLFESSESINLTVIAGGLDYAQQDLLTEKYTLYKENEEKGGYKAMMWYDGRGSVLVDHRLNLNHPDPVLREIFQNLKFRQALSLAINRDEINEVVFRGLATPRAATVRSDVSFFEPWMETYFTQYDPERAKGLLDEMGLKYGPDKRYRLRPDGKPLEITIEYVEMEGPRGGVEELVKEYWEAVGIKVALKRIEQNLWGQRLNAGELDVNVWNLDSTNEIGFHVNPFAQQPYAQKWWTWYNTGGKSGEEPPEEVKRYFELAEEFRKHPLGSEEYKKIGKELATIPLKNLWHIGIIGNMPKPTVIKKGLKNTPTKGVRIYNGYRFWMIYNGDQWYWE